MSAPRLNLAGPTVFETDPIAVFAQMKEVCRARGLEGVAPLDGPPLDFATGALADHALSIYTANVSLIRSCDGVISSLVPFRGPGMDAGTAFEMGYAAALDLPVFAWTTDLRDYLARVAQSETYAPHVVRGADGFWRDQDGLQIEDFGLIENLMPIGVASLAPRRPVYACFEAAIDAASEVLVEKKTTDWPSS
jgi:nucleoside 2-deoxyribosyltransferase